MLGSNKGAPGEAIHHMASTSKVYLKQFSSNSHAQFDRFIMSQKHGRKVGPKSDTPKNSQSMDMS